MAGEPAALDALLAELLPAVQRLCRARLGHRETPLGTADDIAQDVCLAVLRALPRYQQRGRPIHAFVRAVAVHRVADAHRAAARDPAAPVADPPDVVAPAGGPEARLLRAELSQQLAGLLHLLTPHQREVLVLRVARGWSAAETADALGRTPGAVRVTQYRALTRLRAHLSPDRPRWPLPAGPRARRRT